MGLDDGIWICHARPESKKPPMPKGHRSDQHIVEGLWVVTWFKDTPCRGLARKSCWFLCHRLRIHRRSQFRKWCTSGMMYPMWLSQPRVDLSSSYVVCLVNTITCISDDHVLYLSTGRSIRRRQVLSIHPRKICSLAGVPSALSLGTDSRPLRFTGSSSLMWG
jgi:hypothetical protein